MEKSCRTCRHNHFGVCENGTVRCFLEPGDGPDAESLFPRDGRIGGAPVEEAVRLIDAVSRFYESVQADPIFRVEGESEFFCSQWE